MPHRALTQIVRRRHTSWDFVLIVIGCFIAALGFRLFTNANGIVAGGVVGVSTILQKEFGWEPALVGWAINIPLLGLGFAVLGKKEGMRSVLGSFALPMAILLTRNVHPVTHDGLLAAIFGGLTYGAGLGLVLSARGSVGGYTLLGRVGAKKFPVSVTAVIFACDACTIVVGAQIFGADRALYGLVAAFVMRRAIERVLLGFSRAFLATIISSDEEGIRRRILVDMDRGLTLLPATGGYTGEPRSVIMVVLSQTEVPLLRTIVREADSKAFVVITDTAEVLGQGFHGG